jgi:Ca2+-binding EF-hand superfamily protein
LDENNVGFLTADRLRLLMASCSERMSEEEIELFIKNAKPDADGRIDYNEFVRMMTSI